ncbi:L-type lectin-domain containing receptor kinase S.1 [Populus alba x Populus x berolinensis]|nr:L-type lectin-domain containing receptor kinase S.1 [Populus alba x Populus x berolinensis]
MKQTQNSTTTLSSFSTSFIFSILPNIASSPGFGLAFVLSNWTNPPGALASQYFGVFSNPTVPSVAPLLVVEFHTGQNPQSNHPNRNHIGIDLNNIESAKTAPGGYNSSAGFVPVSMGNGQNVRAWIEFDGANFEINVTVAPVGVSRPSVPILSYKNPVIANYTSEEMYVGFSASKTTWVEAQRILAWSFSDTGVARDINDVAEGLNYLHHGWDQVVVHRDIKSSNILLDSDMRGRLGDFGLAKLYGRNEVPNRTRVVGTLGYLAPELVTMAVATSASDIYSFGVVILEVACGRRPIEMGSIEEEDSVLIDLVRDLHAKGKAVEAADERMKGEFEVEEMEMVLKLGLVCCHPDPQRRPSMREVVAVLVGEDVAAAPAELLNVLASGDGGGDGSARGGERGGSNTT